MRITWIVNHRNMSGGVRVIAIYAEKLQERGHDVTIISRPRPVPLLRRRIKSFVLGRGWPVNPNYLPSHLDHIKVKHQIIDSGARPIADRDCPDADVVIATWWETAYWTNDLSPQKGAKAYFVQDFGANDAQPMDKLAETWNMPMHKIVISSYIRDLVKQYVPANEPLPLVGNSVDLEIFRSPVRGKQAVPTVGTMYSTEPFKRLDLCLKAVEIARKTLPDLQLLVFGPSNLSKEYPLPRDTILHQNVPDDRLKEIYNQCDAWLFGPDKEGYGLPILEAMACRTPVIATPAGAAPELLEPGGGLIVPHGDSEGMAKAILQICSMPDRDWRAMSDKAYSTVASYSWDQATDLFEVALRQAVARFGKGPGH
ncbi:MAG TPA: glycosyltransferase family 4 protein [Tepidisphaeraceae bacterium]|jgi:glycosyltransferase involved in cell wall biosynthesis